MHEPPPPGHSSPAVHDAGLSPQLTVQPAQIPFGIDAGALQAWDSTGVGEGPADWVSGGACRAAAAQPASDTLPSSRAGIRANAQLGASVAMRLQRRRQRPAS
jgi:hypothetical protein